VLRCGAPAADQVCGGRHAGPGTGPARTASVTRWRYRAGMPERDYPKLWARLSPDLRDRLLQDSACELTADDVVDLRQAGARVANAYWLDEHAPGGKRWLTSWAFRQFVDDQRDPGSTAPE
jgi:hypothetical protein